MRPIPSESWKSFRRSRLRERVLVCLASFGEAYVGQLSSATGIRRDRVRATLLGAAPKYRVDLSIVGLGLARVEERRGGRVFVVTSAGLRKARSVTAARRRAHGQVGPHLPAAPPAGGAPPARGSASASASASFSVPAA